MNFSCCFRLLLFCRAINAKSLFSSLATFLATAFPSLFLFNPLLPFFFPSLFYLFFIFRHSSRRPFSYLIINSSLSSLLIYFIHRIYPFSLYCLFPYFIPSFVWFCLTLHPPAFLFIHFFSLSLSLSLSLVFSLLLFFFLCLLYVYFLFIPSGFFSLLLFLFLSLHHVYFLSLPTVFLHSFLIIFLSAIFRSLLLSHPVIILSLSLSLSKSPRMNSSLLGDDVAPS